MAVSIAEYFGQKTNQDQIHIKPIDYKSKPELDCPFMDRPCGKLKKGNPPVCSVRKTNDDIWIVCPDRLCSTSRKRNKDSKVESKLVKHQIDILWQIAIEVYRGTFSKDDIGIKREAGIPLEESNNSYHADYIMRNFAPGAKVDEILLEMQGGGETSNTGSITRLVDEWAKKETTNKKLREKTKAGTIETNAWRRQQEQFLVKGNVVSQTGGKMVFAVGTPLYDYLKNRFVRANLRDLKEHNWTLCLLAFKEDPETKDVPGSINFVIDRERLLYTNYSTFVRFLTDQGGPVPQIFEGEFLSLENNLKSV